MAEQTVRIFGQSRELVETTAFEAVQRCHGSPFNLGPMDPRQIGRVCHVSSLSLAGMLARMDDLGLVTRRAPQMGAACHRIEGELDADCIERCYPMLDEMLRTIPADEDGA